MYILIYCDRQSNIFENKRILRVSSLALFVSKSTVILLFMLHADLAGLLFNVAERAAN